MASRRVLHVSSGVKSVGVQPDTRIIALKLRTLVYLPKVVSVTRRYQIYSVARLA